MWLHGTEPGTEGKDAMEMRLFLRGRAWDGGWKIACLVGAQKGWKAWK